VLWSEANQLSSEYIEIWTKNKEVDQLHMKQLAFIINQEDSARFNQIKGRTMTGYFRNNELYKIITKGNGQTVYYAKDKDELIGVNIAQSSDITIWLKDNKPDKISFRVKPTGPYTRLIQRQKKNCSLRILNGSKPRDPRTGMIFSGKNRDQRSVLVFVKKKSSLLG